MSSPALAIAYGIWVRNQTGFVVCAAALLAMALFYPALFAYSVTPATLIASTIPLIGVFSYVLNATVFAQDAGSLASSYPRHMMVLPVKSRTLVFWPMVFGSLLAVGVLVVTVKIVYRSSGLAIPLGLPALAMVVIIAWFQAIAWFPLKVRWIRALIAAFTTLGLGSLPVWILVQGGPEAQLRVAVVLLAYLVTAYPLAFAAVRSERRGDSWHLGFSSKMDRSGVDWAYRNQAARPFQSAALAQLWYEWCCHGRASMAFVGSELLLVWGILLTSHRPIDATLMPFILSLLLLAPTLIVGSTGSMIGRLRPFWVDQRPLNTFVTTRPISNGGLVGAKLRMALVIVVLTWVFTLIGTSACVVLTRSLPGATTLWHRVESLYPGGRAHAICALACVLVPAASFRMLSDGLPFALTGRRWLADGAVLCYFVILAILAACGAWLAQHPSYFSRLIAILPWLVGCAAILKASAAAAAFRYAIHRRLMGWPAFWRIIAVWSGLTTAIVALVMLLGPPSTLISTPSLILGAATCVPLIRFPLSSIAMDWNRHR
jgi:hypothetical protein